MSGVKTDGIPTRPKGSLGSKSVRMIDGKLVGADGLPVPSTYHGDEFDTSSCDGTPHKQNIKPNASYASIVNEGTSTQKVNFCLLETEPGTENADVLIPMSSVLKANARFENTLYGYFLGKRAAFPVVEHYVMNAWKKFGITKAMMNAQGFFFFKFQSAAGIDGVLENGPWFIRSVPIVLKKWSSTANLLKEDLVSIPVWVKIHGVPIAAFTEDGLSAIATKLGTPLMLDSYTSSMCVNSWGRLDFARALIDIRADQIPKETLVISIPFVEGTGFSLHTVKVEYEWKPPRCNTCNVFGHVGDQCPKQVPAVSEKHEGTKVGNGAAGKNKKDSEGLQAPRKPFHGLMVGNPKKVALAAAKQVFVAKKKTKEVSTTKTSNSFEALNKLDTKVDSNTSPSEKLVNQKDDRGKKVTSTEDSTANNSSLYSRWKDVYGTNVTSSYLAGEDEEDDDDDILDPVDSEMADYMSLHDRKMDKKN